jgi:SAM-dependent methyltransferase
MSISCLLCQSTLVKRREVLAKPAGTYWFCDDCDFIFKEPAQRLSATEEKARYETHQNIESPGYRAFFVPVCEAVERLQNGTHGLDYGCGPTAFLSEMLKEKGIGVENYDPYFFPDRGLLQQPYDFVTVTEVVEHFSDPRSSFQEMVDLIKPGGHLFAMTSSPPTNAPFDTWSYRRDLTHISFFSAKTFAFIASHWNLELVESRKPMWIFKKK